MKSKINSITITIFILLLAHTFILPPGQVLAASSLKVEFFNGSLSSQSNTIYPKFKLTNTGTSPITLSDVKLRYYYTIDGEKPQSFFCDYSNITSSNIAGSFVKITSPTATADYYLEVGFTAGAGTLAPGVNIEIQSRISKSDWSNYTQSNDYSFQSTAAAYVQWDRVTAYILGSLVFGTQPDIVIPSPTPTPTVTPASTPTVSPTSTPTPTTSPTKTPTSTPTVTPVISPTKTPASTPTITPVTSPTRTPTSTPTLTPLASPTETPVGTPTFSPTPGETPTNSLYPPLSPIPSDSVKGIMLDVSSYTMSVYQTHSLKVTALLVTDKTSDVTELAQFQSSKPDIASLDVHGVITGLKPGSAQIMVTFGDRTTFAVINITIPYIEIPGYITSTATNNSITLQWYPVYYITGYDVEADGTIVDAGTDRTYTHSGLQVNSNHTYRVRARKGDYTGDWSSLITVTTSSGQSGSVSTKATSTTITISWNEVPGVTGYDISVDGTNVSAGNTLSYDHTDLLPDSQHTYKIRAVFDSGPGEWSPSIVKSTLLAPPGNVTLTATSTDITVKWSPVTNATGYDIEVNDKITFVGNLTEYVHKELLPSTSYHYRVRAKNANGDGDWSAESTEDTLLGKPVNFHTVPGNDSITVNWDSLDGATGYEIEVDGTIVNNGLNTSYVHKDLTINTPHNYRVRAVNSKGKGDWTFSISGGIYNQSVIESIDAIPSGNQLFYQVPELDKSTYQIAFTRPALDKIVENGTSVRLETGTTALIMPSSVMNERSPNQIRINLKSSDVEIKMAGTANAASTPQISRIFEVKFFVAQDTGDTEVKTLKNPVSIELSLSQDFLFKVGNTKKLGVYYLDESTNKWIYAGGKFNSATGKMEFATKRISKYIVLEYNKSFSDVPDGYWAEEAIEILAARHITQGVDATRFNPGGKVTRAEFAAFLVKALGVDTTAYTGKFTDCPQGAWYTPVVEAAAQKGLVNGIGNGKFAPTAYVTREQMAALLMKAYEITTLKSVSGEAAKASVTFTDGDKISSWAQNSVKACYANGLIRGMPDGSFNPGGSALREQVAKVLVQLLELLNKL